MAMFREPQPHPGRHPTTQVSSVAGTTLLDSGALFAGGAEVIIAHGAEHYRLRLTRQNKLILTK